MAYYYPLRDYHQLNAVAYPDHSRPLAGMGEFIRAFWRKGEQMWDQDMNTSLEWWRWWTNVNIMNRWNSPQYPWYSPYYRTYVIEPDHNRPEPQPETIHAVWHQYTQPPFAFYPLKPWAGVTVPVLADRQWIGFSGSGWRGLSMFQEYADEIEIAIFISETRANRIVAQHTVKEPFRLHPTCYSGRVRGWTQFGTLSILKNGVAVGFAAQYEFSSAVRAIGGAPITFNTGDVLAIKAPPVSPMVGKIYKGVSVSIVGELL